MNTELYNTIIGQIENWVSLKISDDFEFRKYQKEQIADIIYNIVSEEKKHHVVEAPTGSGKSLICIISAGVLAEYYNLTSYILCSDLYLFSQYEEFIKKHKQINFGCIKGQTGNYCCDINGEDMRNSDCRMGQISWASLFNKQKAIKLGYPCALKCEYVKARKKAIAAPVTLMTYQLFLYQINVVNTQQENSSFTTRDVLFCDECHNISELVRDKCAPTIKKSDFKYFETIYDFVAEEQTTLFKDDALEDLDLTKVLKNDLYKDWNRICDNLFRKNLSKNEIFNAYVEYHDFIMQFYEAKIYIENIIAKNKAYNMSVSTHDKNAYKATSFLSNHMCLCNDFINTISETDVEYVVRQLNIPDFKENPDAKISATLSCVKEDYLVYLYILSQTNYSVMLSATVGGEKAFVESIGFKYEGEDVYKYDRIPSIFDFSKSPIHFINRYKMSYKEKEISFPKIEEMIYSIIKKHKNERGIIQTGSYENAYHILKNCPPELKKRILLYKDTKEKQEILFTHKHSHNTVLIGPSLVEGVDLPNDECRFIIISKVPYPSLADETTQEKIKNFPLWYDSKTSNAMIQGIGRGVRNDKDYCETYILDACFMTLFLKTQQQYPEELTNRIKMYR